MRLFKYFDDRRLVLLPRRCSPRNSLAARCEARYPSSVIARGNQPWVLNARRKKVFTAADILVITDGQSHALDVQALARSGRRISVVLVGEAICCHKPDISIES